MKNTMKSVKQDSFSHTYLLYFIPGKSTSTTTEYEYLKQQHTNKKGQHRSSNGTQNKETRKHLHSNQLTTATTTTTREKQLRRQEKPLQQKRITYWKSPALTHTHTIPYTHTDTDRAGSQTVLPTHTYLRTWESKPTSFYNNYNNVVVSKTYSYSFAIRQESKRERREWANNLAWAEAGPGPALW